MYFRVLIPIANLNLGDEFDFFVEGFVFTNDLSIKQEFLNSDSFIKQFGQATIDSIKDYVFIVFKGESRESKLISLCENIDEIAFVISGYIDHLIFCSWFVNDNSIYALGTYVELLEPSKDGQVADKGIRGCYRPGIKYATNSGCTVAEICFSETDFERLEYFFHRSLDFGSPSEETKNKLLPIAPGSNVKESSLGKITYKLDRVSRAFLFLQLVRGASLPFLRISYQMALFECLFTIGTLDSTYQITRHPALYLGGSLSDINKNIDLINEAYSVRSKFFHGDIIKDYSPDSLTKMNKRLEELTRIILARVIKEPDLFINSVSKREKSAYRDYWIKRSQDVGYEYTLPSTLKKCTCIANK